MQFLLDVQINLLDIGRGRIVASIQEDEHARVIAQARDLISQRGGGNVALIAGPILPAFPGVAAGPAGHDENAERVGFFEKFVAVEAALQANGVQAHVAHVAKIGVELCGRPPEEQLGRPGCASNQ